MLHLLRTTLVVLILLASTAWTQIPQGLDLKAAKLAKPAASSANLVLDGAVPATEYILGPGDKLKLLAYNISRSEEELSVDVEGRVELPGLGSVAAAGLDLQRFRDTWSTKLSGVFSCDSVSIRVTEPRRFRVRYSGYGTNPESIELAYPARLDAVLAERLLPKLEEREMRARSMPLELKPEEEREQALQILPELSFRHVLVIRDADTLDVDFLSFSLAGSAEGNPLLRDGDHILALGRGPIMELSGPLRMPVGEVEFRSGDTPLDLIKLAGGVQEGYEAIEVEVTRRAPDGAIINTFTCDLGSPRLASFQLKPWDQVFLRGDRSGESMQRAQVSGEVLRPGSYAIEEGVTTLGTLLERAGIDSSRVDMEHITLIRQNENDPEQSFIEEEGPVIGLTWFERSYAKSRSIHGGSSMAREISGASDEVDQLYLHDGDEIRVPIRQRFIELIGAVRNPGLQVYQEGWTLKDYLMEAGGKEPGVPKSTIKLRRAGSVQFVTVKYGTVLLPGDVVMIPYHDELTAWQKFKEGLSVTVQLVTLVLLTR
jgi:protein involved in polysaccharide export with SLBB domain